jgi:undecaprenyl-diphosphatase
MMGGHVDWPLLVKALIMGVVEGLTEFLPISSTGHLILFGDLLDFNGDVAKVFEVFIQTGAVLAILWVYRQRFTRMATGLATDPTMRRFAVNLGIAFLPAALLGFAFGELIKAHLFRAVPVALAFLVGALVILWAERRNTRARVMSVDEMSSLDALKVGCAQCFALIPGTSRSGATIIGGMLFGLSRRAATEFSFYLAVPTLLAAAAYDVFMHRTLLGVEYVPVFGVGFIAAFVSAFFCVRWLLRYLSTHNFMAFGWYRIVFGLVVLITARFGWINWEKG